MNNYYEDVTKKWLSKAKLEYKEVKRAVSIVKDGKRYKTNKRNRILLENMEEENGKWFVENFGGRIEYLPAINEDNGIQCSDYMYYKTKYAKGIFLEEKETHGKGKNVFYHALEDNESQAKIFLIDCTKSNFTDEEIHMRLLRVFRNVETNFVETVIIKNENKLFGVFNKIKKK